MVDATEMEAALRAVIRVAEAAKEPVFGMDPESQAAIRNGIFATIAQVAAQGLGWCGGPPLASYGVKSSMHPEDKLLYDALLDHFRVSDGITVGLPTELVQALAARLANGVTEDGRG
jgi:hypothetical protein